jgi:hypothetical protein
MPLRFGPYTPPALRVGDVAYCHRRGREYRVLDLSPAGWPLTRTAGAGGTAGRLVWIFCDELVRMIEQEAAQDVAEELGLYYSTVTRWRLVMGVRRMNPGTSLLYEELADVRLHDDARQRGADTSALVRREQGRKGTYRRMRTPERAAEMRALREQGLTYQAIADRMGCGITTVRNAIQE